MVASLAQQSWGDGLVIKPTYGAARRETIAKRSLPHNIKRGPFLPESLWNCCLQTPLLHRLRRILGLAKGIAACWGGAGGGQSGPQTLGKSCVW